MRDMRYELELLERFQLVVVDGIPLTEISIGNNETFWHRFQHTVFDGDIKRFAKTKSFAQTQKEESKFKRPFSALFLFLFAMSISTACFLSTFLKKKKVAILSVDKVSSELYKNDFRLQTLYKTLDKNDVSFVEFFHATMNRSIVSNFLKRKRLSFYLEAFDEVWYIYRFLKSLFVKKQPLIIDNVSGTEDEVNFIKTTIKKYLAIKGLLEFRRAILRFFLKSSGIKMIIGIDDVRHYHELMQAGKSLLIPTLVIQHGHFTKYHVGWLKYQKPTNFTYQKADTILVWSNYWKEELIRLNSVYEEGDIKVMGYPEKTAQNMFQKKQQKGLVVLIPHETESPKEEVSEYIRSLNNHKALKIYLKIRPDISKNKQLSEYDSEVISMVTVVENISDMPKPDIVMGVYSTFLYDMALYGIPVGVMNTSMDYGEGMVINGIANQIMLDSAYNDVERTRNMSEDLLERRKEKIDSLLLAEEELSILLKKAGVV